MFPSDKIPNQIGYLILKEDGAVLESGGELENDEKTANIIMSLIQMSDSVDENFITKNNCERISILYDDHSYSICLSNKKIFIVKRKHNLSDTENVTINDVTTTTPPATAEAAINSSLLV